MLTVDRTIYVGISTRSNSEAVDQVRTMVADHGYSVMEVTFDGCLHLKSAVTAVSNDTLVINPEWIEAGTFSELACIEVDPTEPAAANVLGVADMVLFGAGFPRTGERLSAAGFEVRPVDASELAKAEGALTCCSLIFDALDRNKWEPPR